jgi:RimJ/RimL family protein N-acetyltransferase
VTQTETPQPLQELWPLFALRVVTPRVTLRLPGDGDLARVAGVISAGIHDPAEMPFDDPPWTDEASPAREQKWVQRQWASRANWTPEDWRLRLMVEVEGEAAGMQEVMATGFAALRVVSTYSWLGQRWQGQGIGKEMRAAVLHLAFAGLGARAATSEAFTDNAASTAVSRALGYEENGRGFMAKRGVAQPEVRFLLTRERWSERRREDIRIEGLDACLPLFGVA